MSENAPYVTVAVYVPVAVPVGEKGGYTWYELRPTPAIRCKGMSSAAQGCRGCIQWVSPLADGSDVNGRPVRRPLCGFCRDASYLRFELTGSRRYGEH